MFNRTKIEHEPGTGEAGQSLMLVLILLLLGSLIIAPLLAFMGTGLKAGKIYEEKADKAYAADAGIEDALWELECYPLDMLFTDPAYDEYDYSTTWSYTLSDNINSIETLVTIENVWIPKDVTPLPSETAKGIIRTGKLIVSSSVPGATSYTIKLAYYPEETEDLRVETLGIWLPPGFSYVAGSSNLEADPGEPYYSVPTTTPYNGGQSVVWSFTSLPFEDLPGADPLYSPMASDITLEFSPTKPDSTPEALSWITTSGVADIPLSWDADTKVYQITSTADDTEVEAYSIKSELRELESAIAGDYSSIGNTLMTATGDDRYRDRLLKESSATVDAGDIPETARVKKAWLYWSGWIEGGNEIEIWRDECANFDNWTAGSDWAVYSGEFRGYHDGEEADRYLTLTPSLDLSSYTGETITVFFNQDESGWLEDSDRLCFALSNDGGNTWSDNIEAFRNDNPYESFSYTLADEYLTNNFKLRFYLESFSGSSEYAYIDNISIIQHDIQVDTILFNGNEITADEQQFEENDDRTYTVGTWSYSCFYDATNLVEQMIDDEALEPNGAGTYTVGHVIRARAGYPAYSFELYPTSEETGYPLGAPATASTTRYEYAYAGWSLILIYTSPETKGHQLYLYDDFTFVGSDATLELPISGFVTPEDSEGSRLTCFVGEGDDRYTGDYIEVNGNRLSDAVNPQNNVWNSYSNSLDNPSQEGIDLDTFDVSAYINPGDTSAMIELGSDIEIYNSVYIILSFRSETKIGSTCIYLIGN